MAVPRIFRIFKVREEGNLEFWVSNLVIVLSTILGVYLAAQAGFTTALQFEIARGEREGYYMRRAMLDELKDNLEQADVFSKNMIENGWRMREMNPEIFKMQSFVWETMRQQSTTFQLPSHILTGFRRYYDKTAEYARRMAVGQGTGAEAAREWMKDTQDIREKLIPGMETEITQLREKLVGRGIQIN
jgi:hypothetical protein